MIHSHIPKINLLEAGWYVIYQDGTCVTENEMLWTQVPNKNNIKVMGLKWRHKYFELENKAPYVPPGETHFREIAVSSAQLQVSEPSITARYIGYYGPKGKIITRVELATGKFITEEIPYI